MDDIQREEYDRKEEMLDSINILIEIADWLNDKSYKEDLEAIKEKLEDELEPEREILEKEQRDEQRWQMNEYWKTQL